MNTSKLKKDLKELKAGIDNPNIPDNIKEGMKETIADLEAKIADADKGEGEPSEAPAEPSEKPKGKRGRPKKEKKGQTWKGFLKEKMGAYMREGLSHGDAMKKAGVEWKKIKGEGEPSEAPAEPSEKPKGKKRGRPRKKHKAKRIYFISKKVRAAAAERMKKYARKKGAKKRKPIDKEEVKKRITKYIFRRKRRQERHTKYISKPKTPAPPSTGTTGLLKLASKLHIDLSRLESAIKKLKTRKEKVGKQPSEREIKMRVRREMYRELKKKLKFGSGGNA